MSKLREMIENPWVNFISGLILLLSAGNEIIHTIDKTEIGTHHGVAIFGLIQTIKYLPHILDGTEQVSKITKN